MRRRQFVGACTAAAIAAPLGTPISALASVPSDLALAAPSADPPFKLSVMLWTVYPKLPFAERLEKVAAAGYHSIELVGEYKDWSKSDFAAARKKMLQLGISVDGTAGVWHAIADPADRDAFLKAIID